MPGCHRPQLVTGVGPVRLIGQSFDLFDLGGQIGELSRVQQRHLDVGGRDHSVRDAAFDLEGPGGRLARQCVRQQRN
jgi:hypothetical protein